jgi:hypothetical protein
MQTNREKDPATKMKTIALLALGACALAAQNVPFGETQTRDGNMVSLMPLGPFPATLAPYLFEIPPDLRFYGLIVSVAPSDARADSISASVMLTTDDGNSQLCYASAKADPTSTTIFTSLFIRTGARTVVSVQGLTIMVGSSFPFGVAMDSEPSVCVVVPTAARSHSYPEQTNREKDPA